MLTLGHIDLNIATACNFACTSCSHASPVNPVWFMPLEVIERDLNAVKPFLQCRNIHLVGGEPLTNKQLPEILRLVKRIRIDETTIVITNASLLPRMPEEFWKELEYLQISSYPKLDKSCITLAEQKSKEFGFGLGVREFTAFYQQIRSVESDGSNFHGCHWAVDCPTIHDGYFFLCPQSAFFPKSIMGLDANVDGLSLDGITEERLKAFQNRKEPLNACRKCLANEMQLKPWTESKRIEWIQESTL